jgi:hypothetical protein
MPPLWEYFSLSARSRLAHRFRRRADSRNWPPEEFPADGVTNEPV